MLDPACTQSLHRYRVSAGVNNRYYSQLCPNSTRRARPNFARDPGLRTGLRQSLIVSASSLRTLCGRRLFSISTCMDFVHRSGRVANKVCGSV